MQDKETSNLGILIDLKKKRIRIHRNTLRAIGDPRHVLLLVNPDVRTVAVMSTTAADKRGHKVYTSPESNRKAYELYSTSLIRNLSILNPNWQEPFKYRMQGEMIPNEGTVVFRMDAATPIGI